MLHIGIVLATAHAPNYIAAATSYLFNRIVIVEQY